MEQVRRWDTGAVGQVERTDQGYLRAPAAITKTGVFAYRLPGGKVRRELRLPTEVFDDAAVRSFGLSPLTNGHPPVMLNSRNTARYQVGSVVEPKRDGDHVAAYVQVTDADAIEAVEAGRRQLSCGYNCALERKTGITHGIEGVPDGLHYDAIQRNIRGNHVALVDSGRAGSTVQLRLDQADAFQIEDADQAIEPNPKNQAVIGQPTNTDGNDLAAPAAGGYPMESKITVDGVTFEATPQVAQAVGKLVKRLDDAEMVIRDFKKFHEQEKARADAAEENLAAEKKAHADALAPDKVQAAVDARLALERVAKPILGDEVKLDGMVDADIKRAVVLATAKDKETTEKRLDGCDPAYLQARYDAAIEAWEKPEPRNDALAAARQAGQQTARVDSADEARKRMMQHNFDLGRKPLQ
jgi:hypothetical protein